MNLSKFLLYNNCIGFDLPTNLDFMSIIFLERYDLRMERPVEHLLVFIYTFNKYPRMYDVVLPSHIQFHCGLICQLD